MNKVQKYNSFNTNTPSSESYRNYLCNSMIVTWWEKISKVSYECHVKYNFLTDMNQIEFAWQLLV
jgi:formate-dependent nitrite reductase cytochrome c552 subunit